MQCADKGDTQLVHAVDQEMNKINVDKASGLLKNYGGTKDVSLSRHSRSRSVSSLLKLINILKKFCVFFSFSR